MFLYLLPQFNHVKGRKHFVNVHLTLSLSLFLAAVFIILFQASTNESISGEAIIISSGSITDLGFSSILIITAAILLALGIIGSDDLETIAKKHDTSRPGMTRGEFIKLALAGAIATRLGLIPLSTYAQPGKLDEEALLYNISLGTFKKRENAESMMREISEKLKDTPTLTRQLAVRKEGSKYKLMLDAHTLANDAEIIVNHLKSRNIDSFRVLESYYYNNQATLNRFALVVVENDIGGVVREYTTAYGDELRATAKSLIEINNERAPRKGDIIRVPVRFLKTPYQLGMKPGKDYVEVKLKKGETIFSIAASYTVGDVDRNIEIIKRFNDIKKGQLSRIADGTVIIIPSEIYHDPNKSIELTEDPNDMDSLTILTTEKGDDEGRKKKEALEKKIPEARKIRGDARVLRGDFAVVRDTKMPSVLAETFNIHCKKQIEFYSNDDNLRMLAAAYGQGILNYKREAKPGLKLAIIDDGHGAQDPGAIDTEFGTGKQEREFTIKLQGFLADYLEKHGLKAVKLNYKGKADRKKRTRFYTGEANRLGDKDNSVYISIHVDYAPKNTSPRPPTIWVHNKGSQKFSTLLGDYMQQQTMPFYEAHRQ